MAKNVAPVMQPALYQRNDNGAEEGGPIDWLLARMAGYGDDAALVWRGRSVGYGELLAAVDHWLQRLDDAGVVAGQTVVLSGDYSPEAVALLLALIQRRTIVVPLTEAVGAQQGEFIEIVAADVVIHFGEADEWRIEPRSSQTQPGQLQPPLIAELAARGNPGLVLFSSGSTGKSKAALHDFSGLLEKFKQPRHRRCTLTFLLLDHIGGLNTLLYALSNGGTMVTVRSRDPDVVCAAIAAHRVDLLPTSPTFLNLLLISEAHARHDLSSLRTITYGTEVMPESTLLRLREIFPHADLLQTYGLSEVGILRSKSRASDSLFVKVGGEGFETRVQDGTLWIRAQSAMLGYLNAPSPFDAEGWMNTGDQVIVDGEYIRILGRRSEIINVGGQKVYPAEVESVLLQMSNVRDAVVVGEASAITGQIVTARVTLHEPEEPAAFRRRMAAHCRSLLAPFKIPLRVTVETNELYNARFKRMRR
jgi:acyl-coenzyme A synthetase/AMP-(fatty) acid ligase